jgi:hypothetical protein
MGQSRSTKVGFAGTGVPLANLSPEGVRFSLSAR